MKSVKLFTYLLLAGSLSFFSCTKEADIPTETKEILYQGPWKVEYYFTGQDHTAQFADYSFEFNRDGSVAFTKNGTATMGSWKVLRNVNGFDLLELSIPPANADWQPLNSSWKVVGKNYLQMQLEADTQNQLRISKNR